MAKGHLDRRRHFKSVNESWAKLKREEKRNKKEEDTVGHCVCLQKSPEVFFTRRQSFHINAANTLTPT